MDISAPLSVKVFSAQLDAITADDAARAVRDSARRVLRRRRLAAVLQRLLDAAVLIRMDVDWRRSMVVADASLRALGLQSWGVVLDSGRDVGACVGDVGGRCRLRQLVPSWL